MRRLSSRAIRSKVQRKWVLMRDDSYLFPIIFLRRQIDRKERLLLQCPDHLHPRRMTTPFEYSAQEPIDNVEGQGLSDNTGADRRNHPA